jgi:putative FmdB family regulatory protein
LKIVGEESMPTYEYRCKVCGHQFEIFQFMSDEPMKLCPVCNGEIERLIGTGGGLIFKGSGFYETDYRSDSYKKGVKQEKSTSSTDKTDVKPKATANK